METLSWIFIFALIFFPAMALWIKWREKRMETG